MTNVNSTNTNGSTFATAAAAGAGAAAGSALTTKYAAPAIIKFANNLQTDTFVKSEKVVNAVKKAKVPQIAAKVGTFVKEHPTKTAAIGAAAVAAVGALLAGTFTKSNESISGHQG